MTLAKLPSRRPYFLRAMHQWLTDSGLTPQVIVSAEADGAEVPRAHVRDGKIVLNISHSATRHLELGNEWLEFSARFGGVAHQVRVPLGAVLAIYARETGEGMVFDEPDGVSPGTTQAAGGVSPAAADTGSGDEPQPPGPPRSPRRGRPQLKVVK